MFLFPDQRVCHIYKLHLNLLVLNLCKCNQIKDVRSEVVLHVPRSIERASLVRTWASTSAQLRLVAYTWLCQWFESFICELKISAIGTGKMEIMIIDFFLRYHLGMGSLARLFERAGNVGR